MYKIFITYLSAALISLSTISFADDHTPKKNLINKLKEEITALGAEPVKRKGILSSLQNGLMS